MLGWEPQVPLREGIRRTVEYFRELKASSSIESRTMQSIGPGPN
jgi:hypothetical protein